MKHATSTGMVRAICVVTVVAVAFGAVANTAQATFDLQVTEIWPGNANGSNLSEDWFEVTNLGDMPWVAAADGDLYFDDDSVDETTADLMSGVLQIDPGESVIFVDDSATTDWANLWGAVVSPLPQIGTYAGAGLGQGGDAVALFMSFGAPTAGDVIEIETFGDLNGSAGASWDSFLGELSYVGNASGAVQTLSFNDENEFAIGSPGAIPEPASLVLLATSALCLVRRRR